MADLTQQQREVIAQCTRDEASRVQLEQLFEAQQLMSSIVEHQAELICRYLPDMTLTFVNLAYCRFVGRQASELIGHSFLNVIDEEFRDAVQEEFAVYVQNPRYLFNEHSARRHDGAIRWLQWTRQPIFSESGDLIEIQAVGRDLTTQRMSDHAVSQSEERYRRLVEGSPDGILITSQTSVRHVNKALVQMLGAESDCDLIGKTVFDIVHPDYHTLIEGRITTLGHDSEAETRRQERYCRVDGSTVDVEVTIIPIEFGGSPASLTFVRDITARKKSETTLNDFQEQLKTLHTLSIHLSKAESFDEFCHDAVAEGSARLGFDRLGLWFLDDTRTHVVGSYGTNEQGQVCDERHQMNPVTDRLQSSLFDQGHTISFWENIDLCDYTNAVIGKGWNALAPLWDGGQVIGYMSADNLLHQKPASPQQLELLMLYGSTLGHLATRKRAEDALRSYQDNLKALHRLGVGLSKADSFDEFCRMAVEEGREQLGFDRLGLWFLSDDKAFTVGSYGTDEQGRTIDERDARYPINDEFAGSSFPPGESFAVTIDTNLKDAYGNVIGQGWSSLSGLWNGDEIIGYLAADNLIHHKPLTPQQQELLTLYGSTLGHLATRKRAEDALRDYQDSLKTLHRLGIDLSKADSFDTFCQQAVENGRDRLGFDRLGLWFLNDDRTHMIGSFGTDAQGQTTDERHEQHNIDTQYFAESFAAGESLVVYENINLLDGTGNALGKGWAAMAVLRTGDEIIGYMSADNLVNQRALSPQQAELLTLYGATLGHLATRIRAQEALTQQQNAEKHFQEQLKSLNEISIDLAQCETFDELCRQAIETGCQRLGFERMSLWHIHQDKPDYVHGSYGTDESGQIRAEWHIQRHIPELAGTKTHRVLTNRSLVEVDADHVLRNDRNEPVGRGWMAVTALRDGQQVIGCLYADKFITGKPFDTYQIELLMLYGSTLGHLAKRKWIEDNLRRSEERYRTIFEGASIGMCLSDPEGHAVSPNPAYLQMLGYTAEELRQMTFIDYTHPDDREHNWQMFRQLMNGEISHYQIEKRLICKNGKIIWVRLAASLFPNTDHDEPLSFALIQNISEQKRATLDLHSSEARFRAIFEGSRIGITVVDQRGCSVSCNPAYAAMLDYTQHELHEIPFVEFTHPEDRETSLAMFQAVFDGKAKHHQFEARYIRKDGEIVGVRMNISSFPVSDQNEKLVIALAEDISDIKKAETSLRESEARNRALVAAIPDMIFVQDRDGVLLDYHTPMKDTWFASPEKFLFRRMDQVLPPETIQIIQPAFEAAVETGEMQMVEYPLPAKDASGYYEARLITYGDDRVLSMIRDVTERKRMEQQNLELAVQRERINIIADFIRDASHEFRTPLSVINSQVYLAMHLDDAEARREQLAGIQEQSEIILKLVESLVTMSRLDSDMSMKYTPVGIGDILRALHTGFQQRAEKKGITLLLEQDNDLPWVPGDSDDLYRAFYNVVENALRYTLRDGTITIRARRANNDLFEVQIKDTGSGIEAADLPHIFERFFRGDRAHSTPGFGLGLPVTRRIIERHGGSIDVESQPGVGSIFTITLPLRQPHSDVDSLLQARTS